MSSDKLEPMLSAGRQELYVPVWALSILNVVFVAAGIYVATLGGTVALATGGVIVLVGLSGLASIMMGGS